MESWLSFGHGKLLSDLNYPSCYGFQVSKWLFSINFLEPILLLCTLILVRMGHWLPELRSEVKTKLSCRHCWHQPWMAHKVKYIYFVLSVTVTVLKYHVSTQRKQPLWSLWLVYFFWVCMMSRLGPIIKSEAKWQGPPINDVCLIFGILALVWPDFYPSLFHLKSMQSPLLGLIL